MFTIRRITRATLGLLLITTTSLVSPQAFASSPPQTSHLSPSTKGDVNNGQYATTLELTRNGVTTITKTDIKPQLVTPDAAGPQNALIHCNKAYLYTDQDGTYSIQHACAGTTAPWGYRFSAAFCSIERGNIHESGMTWTRNGVVQGMQAFHDYGCSTVSDQFHGTYNPVRDYDKVTYKDIFTFLIQGGSGKLTIEGSFQALGSTCSPTSC